jgi:prevent-host-death family protein
MAVCGYTRRMKTVSIREARNRFSELVRRAEAGESILVFRDGKPVAQIVPIEAQAGGIDWAAGDAYLKSIGLERPVFEISEDFDAPLFENFMETPLAGPK